MSVTVYSKAGCGPCVVTKVALKKVQIPFTEVRVDQDPEGLEVVRSLGYSGVPVVVVLDDQDQVVDHWNGFSEAKIATLSS